MANRLNSNIRLRSNHNFNLNVQHGDNYIRVTGQNKDGQVDKAIMLNDEQCQQKVESLVEEIASYQVQQINDFAENAESDYKKQLNSTLEDIKDFFN